MKMLFRQLQSGLSFLTYLLWIDICYVLQVISRSWNALPSTSIGPFLWPIFCGLKSAMSLLLCFSNLFAGIWRDSSSDNCHESEFFLCVEYIGYNKLCVSWEKILFAWYLKSFFIRQLWCLTFLCVEHIGNKKALWLMRNNTAHELTACKVFISTCLCFDVVIIKPQECDYCSLL